jgi:FAD/FMN-containing dehydrogenase
LIPGSSLSYVTEDKLTDVASMTDEVVSQLSKAIRGNVITPASSEYEVARKVYNGMIDRRPAAIVRCADVADVKAAVNFARQDGLTVAIRGGGHNGPGLGVCDHGLVIDLSPMKGVRVDPTNRMVGVESGCTQGDVDHASHAFGLAVPAGIVSTTGIAGLTLGGGTGYLTRKYGLTIDNGQSETAWAFRDATWSMVIAGISPDPSQAEAITAWAKEYWEAVHPYTLGGAYVNFMMEEGVDRIKATYRANYGRLTEIKRKHDPNNFFHINQNIKPD